MRSHMLGRRDKIEEDDRSTCPEVLPALRDTSRRSDMLILTPRLS